MTDLARMERLETRLDRLETLLEKQHDLLLQLATDMASARQWQQGSDNNTGRFWTQDWPGMQDRVARLERTVPTLATHRDVQAVVTALDGLKRYVWMGLGAVAVLTGILQIWRAGA